VPRQVAPGGQVDRGGRVPGDHVDDGSGGQLADAGSQLQEQGYAGAVAAVDDYRLWRRGYAGVPAVLRAWRRGAGRRGARGPLARAGSGSKCHWPFICQVITSRCGGSQTSTRPQSHSLPSTPRSYHRPPSRGSMMASAISAWPMWYSRGHQVLNEPVKTRNAFSIGTPTVIVPLIAGIVGVLLIAPPVPGRLRAER